MSTENQQAPEQLFESMNLESKRLLQGLIRSEDTSNVKNLTTFGLSWSCNLDKSPGWLEMVTKYQHDQFKVWTDLMSGTIFSLRKTVALIQMNGQNFLSSILLSSLSAHS